MHYLYEQTNLSSPHGYVQIKFKDVFECAGTDGHRFVLPLYLYNHHNLPDYMKHEEKLFVWQQTDRCFPVGDEQYPDCWIVEIMSL